MRLFPRPGHIVAVAGVAVMGICCLPLEATYKWTGCLGDLYGRFCRWADDQQAHIDDLN